MSRAIPLKGKVASTGNSNANGPSLSKAAIGVVTMDGNISVDPAFGAFLLNPESLEESKSSNWAQNQIQGQSDPVLQWTSGGPRILTFDALVTLDTSDLGKTPRTVSDDIKDAAINAVGSIASNFFGVNVPPLSDFFSSTPAGTTLSIAKHLNYYRSLLYPTYNTATKKLESSPPLLVLFFGNSIQGNFGQVSLMGELSNQKWNPNIHTWVLTNLRIKITKQLMNLDPMEAYVSFQFVEYVVSSRSASNFNPNPNEKSQVQLELPSIRYTTA